MSAMFVVKYIIVRDFEKISAALREKQTSLSRQSISFSLPKY